MNRLLSDDELMGQTAPQGQQGLLSDEELAAPSRTPGLLVSPETTGEPALGRAEAPPLQPGQRSEPLPPQPPRQPRDYYLGIGGIGPHRDDLDPTTQAMMDLAFDVTASFNHRLAQVVGLPIAAVNEVIQSIGMEGLDDPLEAVTDAFSAAGFHTDGPDNLARQIGRETFDNLLIASVMIRAAPILEQVGSAAVGQATTALGRIGEAGRRTVGEFGRATGAHPGTVIGSEVGAAIGGPIGGEVAGGPGEVAGAMVGAGAGATGLVRKGASAAGQIIGGTTGAVSAGAILGLPGFIVGGMAGAAQGGRAMRRGVERLLTRRDMPTTPLRSGHDPMVAQQYAEEAVTGLRLRAEADIDNALREATGLREGGATTMAASERLWRGVHQAYRRAQGEADKLWARVDKTKEVEFSDLHALTERMTREAGPVGTDALPGDIFKRLEILSAGPDDTFVTTATIRDMLALRSSIGAQLREGVFHDGLRRNLTLIDNAIVDIMAKQYPGDRDLAAARSYTKWLHSKFSQGELGNFYGRRGRDPSFLQEPTQSAERLVRSERGGAQLGEAAERLNIPALRSRAAAFVQGLVRNIADELGPQKGQNYLRKQETRNFLKHFPAEHARIEEGSIRLGQALERQTTIANSAFARFADESVEAAIPRLLRGGTMQDQRGAHEVIARLREDTTGEAMKGFQNGLIDWLVLKSGSRPTSMEAMLSDRHTRAVFADAFGPDGITRLDRIVKTGVQLSGTFSERFNQKAQSLIGRFFGAGLVKQAGSVSPMSGGKGSGPSIQQTGAGAAYFDMVWRTVTRTTPPEQLIAEALRNPRAERLFYMQIPDNIHDLRRSTDLIRGVVASLEGGKRVWESDNEARE